MRKVFEVFVVVSFLGLVGFALAGKAYVSPRRGNRLDIAIAKQSTILYGASYLTFFKYPDGTLLVNDVSSTDGGKIWKKCQPIPAGADVGAFGRLSDGTALVLGFTTERVEEGKFRGRRWISKDNGQSWDGPLEAILYIPSAVCSEDADGKRYGPWIHRSIIELPGGEMLASMYGYFAVAAAASTEEPEDRKCRTFVVKSADAGATWRYLSTVAYSSRPGEEGFCEPSMVLLASNQILCVMRAGTEMYQCRSSDWGQTWSEPESLGVSGVEPHLCLMDSGILACAYGRPGTHVAFDATGTGKAWGPRITAFDGSSSGCTSLEEIAPGVLLCVYDAQNFVEQEGAAPVNCIRGAFITVEHK